MYSKNLLSGKLARIRFWDVPWQPVKVFGENIHFIAIIAGRLFCGHKEGDVVVKDVGGRTNISTCLLVVVNALNPNLSHTLSSFTFRVQERGDKTKP